ncbi:hypothetical protein HYX58_00660 [Candidatus Dependentiae bacterium]|nr:hypothetical protein [Candidatus Dependentiae bacterium]
MKKIVIIVMIVLANRISGMEKKVTETDLVSFAEKNLKQMAQINQGIQLIEIIKSVGTDTTESKKTTKKTYRVVRNPQTEIAESTHSIRNKTRFNTDGSVEYHAALELYKSTLPDEKKKILEQEHEEEDTLLGLYNIDCANESFTPEKEETAAVVDSSEKIEEQNKIDGK